MTPQQEYEQALLNLQKTLDEFDVAGFQKNIQEAQDAIKNLMLVINGHNHTNLCDKTSCIL